MNFRLFTLPGTLLIAMAFFFSACTKEGPAGPAGATGPAGPAGPTGATGVAGPAGTANVVYSNWLDVTYKPAAADSSVWSAELTATRLVDSILQKGEVRVYLNAGTAASPFIVPLPIYEPFVIGIIINPYFQVGKINLVATDDAGTFVSTTNNQKAWQYRYIIIPGGTATGRQASINWNDYNEVKTYLGLKD